MTFAIAVHNASSGLPQERELAVLLIGFARAQNGLRKMGVVIGIGPKLRLHRETCPRHHILTIQTGDIRENPFAIIDLHAGFS